MAYTLFYQKDIKKDLEKLSNTTKKIIKKAIEDKLIQDPEIFVKPLRYNLKGYHCLRVGDYRVIYIVDDDLLEVIILLILHRRQAYR